MVQNFPEKTDIFIKTTFRVTGTDTKLDPDGEGAFITVIDLTGTVRVDGVAMSREAQGIYSYWWEASTVGRGSFIVSVTGEFSTHTYVVEDRVELV